MFLIDKLRLISSCTSSLGEVCNIMKDMTIDSLVCGQTLLQTNVV